MTSEFYTDVMPTVSTYLNNYGGNRLYRVAADLPIQCCRRDLMKDRNARKIPGYRYIIIHSDG